MEKQRVYFVIDMKSFFASVECAERNLNPMTTKLVVADKERTNATVCLAVSPALKELGVRNRCRLFEIPSNIEYIVAKPRMNKYIEYASEIYAIYLKYISKDDIHVYSIDECFLDVTDYLKIYKMRAKPFANMLMNEIWEKLKIPATTGIGTNMYLAKIALDITAKHSKDRIGWLNEKKFISELWKHQPLTDFWGISSGISKRLESIGVFSMEGIAKSDENLLYDMFGVNAELLIDHAFGRETCLMEDVKNYKSQSKSKSSSQILPCDYTFDEAKIVMKEMIQNGCYDLFKDGYVTDLIHLFVSYGDDRKSVSKGTKRMPICTNLYSKICPFVEKLFDEIVDKNRKIRQIGYDFACLQDLDKERYDFFTSVEEIKKEKKLMKSILKLKKDFGKNAILKGIDIFEKSTQKDRNKMVGGHNGG